MQKKQKEKKLPIHRSSKEEHRGAELKEESVI